jgi:tetratricopeptide (TPR) repeat protein
LRERTGEELFEIRAYHLDQASALHAELDGRTPPALAAEAAEALEGAARRALAREAYGSARKLALRASELVPTLERCYLAARVAWRLGDYPVVAEEMEDVRAAAADAGDRRFHGKALTALGEVALYQGADAVRALELIEEALDVLEDVPDAAAHFEALAARAKVASWLGDPAANLAYTEQALAVAAAAGRKDLETLAALGLAQTYLHRLELERAEPLIARASELADESGSIVARARSLATVGWLREAEGELAEAEDAYGQALELFTEVGFGQGRALTLNHLGRLARLAGQTVRAERQLREAIRILKGLGDRGYLCESQRELAQVLAADGRLEEAEKVALEARETVGPQDAASLVTTTMALGIVRAAQGRDEEAEALLREALAAGQALSPGAELEPLAALAQFLGERGREDEAAPIEARIAELSPSAAKTASAASS